MKKTPLKRKTPLTAKTSLRAKKGVIAKSKPKKAPTVTKLKKDLWEAVKIFIRNRDNMTCFTSGVKVEGSNCHCGHGIPSSVGGVLLRYHPLNLHVQSYVENIHHSGNGGEYYRRSVQKYGQDTVDRLYALKNKSVKADKYFYQTLIDLYKKGNQQEIIDFIEQ